MGAVETLDRRCGVLAIATLTAQHCRPAALPAVLTLTPCPAALQVGCDALWPTAGADGACWGYAAWDRQHESSRNIVAPWLGGSSWGFVSLNGIKAAIDL